MTFKSYTIFIIIFFNIVFYSKSYAEEQNKYKKNTLAVFDFAANNVPQSYSKIVRNFFEVSFYETGEYKLLEREQISRVMKEKSITRSLCTSTDCFVKIGKNLYADYIVVGSVDKLHWYKINVRVVSVSKGEILVAYSKRFKSEKEMDQIVGKLVNRITRDLKRYRKRGRVRTRFFDKYNLFFSLNINYLYPLRSFGNIVGHGFGLMFDVNVKNVFVDNLIVGFGTGYQRFEGKKNSSDSCNIIPITINLGYFINPIKIFYILPSLSIGVNIVILQHGSGEGFSINENSTKTDADPVLKGGLVFGIIPITNFHIQFGAKYSADFENDEVLDFLEFNLGVVFVF